MLVIRTAGNPEAYLAARVSSFPGKTVVARCFHRTTQGNTTPGGLLPYRRYRNATNAAQLAL